MYDKSILAKSTGASLGVVAIVGMLFLSTGTAFALPIAGIGGFKIDATKITGENLKLYPAAGGDSENVKRYPTAVVELTQTTITDLTLTKRFDLDKFGLPDPTPNNNNGNYSARLVITAGDQANKVSTDGILLKTPSLGAKKATFNGLTINEENSGNIQQVFEITADAQTGLAEDEYNPGVIRNQNLALESPSGSKGLVLEEPTIRATYLTTSQIVLPNLKLKVQFSPENAKFNDPGTDYGVN